MNKIEFREIIELFLTISIHQIKSEGEVPNVNFKFEDEAHLFFNDIVKKPFVLAGFWTPDATYDDVDFVFSRSNDDCLNIYVKDIKKFFESLMNITNNLIRLYEFYGIQSEPRNLAMQVMRRIWLKMGIADFEDVELFLERQSEFAKNILLDNRFESKISSSYDFDIYMKTLSNDTFDESTRSMVFTIKSNGEEYELPRILYDIDDSNTCYIYGVQNKSEKKSKIIQRKLYKLNENNSEFNVHPSKVYALMLFIKQLKEKNISNVIVPSMQVLSYHYHELLSEESKRNFEEEKKQLEKFPDNDTVKKNFEKTQKWYNKVYNNQDKISYLKTEELFYLVYRIIEKDVDMELINEPNINGDNLTIRIKHQSH